MSNKLFICVFFCLFLFSSLTVHADENTVSLAPIPDEGLPYEGWHQEDDTWYYLDEDGVPMTGWQFVETDWYYFIPETGEMAHDCWVADNKGIPCYLTDYGTLKFGGLSWIGDSMTANLLPSYAILQCFYNPHVVAKSLKCPYEDYEDNPSGLTIAKAMVTAGSMENTLVFELGSNNDWHTPDLTFTDKIHMLLDIVDKDNFKLVLVTCYTVDDETTESYFGELNREMRKLAEDNVNIAVAD